MQRLIRSMVTVPTALALVLASGCTPPAAAPPPAPVDYSDAISSLETLIEREVSTKELAGLSIALVDDQRIIWSRGFGFASLSDSVPATEHTVYRVGSVSKLFTDIAVMQAVERGELDLDAPVRRYLPDFAPGNDSGREITLRQLMSHRSGLVREPPLGNYFDDSGATLSATVASLNGVPLVFQPEARSKYSNAGIAVVGRVVEQVSGESFAPLLQRTILTPAGMRSSAFERPDRGELASGIMWSYDHRSFEAPTFDLGMAPAGSMYSTAEDLGRFLSILFAGGVAPQGRILSQESLHEMWRPQFASAGAERGFGLGFAISSLDGHRRVGHGGAIYGFATELAALPDQKLGAVVLTNVDIANSVVERIADAALQLMLAAREGRPLPSFPVTEPVPTELAQRLAGLYGDGDTGFELVARPQGLYLTHNRGGLRAALRLRGDTLITDDRLAHGTRLLMLGDGQLRVDGRTVSRRDARRPAPPPAEWEGLIGEYGWDHNTLYILERDGRLHSLIEWFFLDPLEQVGPDVFAFPDRGLYPGERLVFTRDPATGRAVSVEAASVTFPRRAVGTEGGATFQIEPVRPVDELVREALASSPPVEQGSFRQSDLVDLATLDPTLRFDVRYATTNNFMGAVVYSQARAFLQRPAAEAVVRANRRLAEHGYGLLIHDAYRPWYVTKVFWDATPEEMKHFVANPAHGSRHNRGAAVDLTLYDLATGNVIETVSGYDEFSPRSYPDYPGGTSLQRWHRELLRDAMEAEGFKVYEWEWWHFDYDDWRSYPIGNVTFDRIR